jgi:outer membrane protein OmpA-like peptidoglycan-associated protein
MKILASTTPLLLLMAGVMTLTACSSSAVKPDGSAAVRQKLTALQADPNLANRAVLPVQQAETAVLAAELPTKDKALASYRVKLADKKVEIAKAVAQTNYLDEQYKTLGAQQADARLDSRTQEADAARYDAKLARQDATSAEAESELAKQQALELQQQIQQLNAKETERGWVVTLGDVLFDTGRAELKEGSLSNLSKLSAFLNRYQDRKVQIEGHTDSIGSSGSNQGLSERRANSVRRYLENQGISADRLTTAGLGEDSPVTDNDTAASRQQNRRVEVIIANTASPNSAAE